MMFQDVELGADKLVGSSIVSPPSGGSCDIRETKPDAFSAIPKEFLAASDLQFQLG